MTQLGYAAILLALLAASGGASVALWGARTRQPRWTRRAELALFATAGLVALATSVLLFLLLSRDFQVQYVYAHTSTYQPVLYVISALWAGQEGSLLLWLLLLCVITVIVLSQKPHWPTALWPYALAALATIQAFFALILVALQNPFVKLAMTPLEGVGLLPALENPGMLIHPPVLFLGYALYSVPFAFTLALLASGPLQGHARVSGLSLARKWGLVAWLFLGLGILIGAWWAYVELGWGGYWSWDPVENASLVPWLVGTAYLHALLVQERQGALKRWSAALAIATFLLCIFATLVTRGGIITSALHGFSQTVQPIAYYLLTFMVAVTGLSAVLFYRQRQNLNDEQEPENLLTRESTLLLSILIFVGLAAAILVGMIFPSLAQALRGVQMELGTAFYTRVFTPLGLVILLLLGFCTLLGWRETPWQKLWQTLRFTVMAALVLVGALVVLGVRQPLALLAYALIAFAAGGIGVAFAQSTLQRSRLRGEAPLRAAVGLFRAGRRRYGGQLVHLSILLIALAIVGSSLFKSEQSVTLARGADAHVQGYTLKYEDLTMREEPGKQRYIATIGLYQGQTRVGAIKPEKDYYANVQDFATEVAIHTTPREDLYVALDSIDSTGVASFRVSIYPLVVWLWVGGGLLLLGTLVALWPMSQKRTEDTDGA